MQIAILLDYIIRYACTEQRKNTASEWTVVSQLDERMEMEVEERGKNLEFKVVFIVTQSTILSVGSWNIWWKPLPNSKKQGVEENTIIKNNLCIWKDTLGSSHIQCLFCIRGIHAVVVWVIDNPLHNLIWFLMKVLHFSGICLTISVMNHSI